MVIWAVFTGEYPSTKQVFHILPCQGLDKTFIVCDQVSCQNALFLLKLYDLIFNCVFTYHAIGKNILGLSDTVGTVDGLLLDGRVPPWIHDINIVGCRQVQANASGLE
jgi:hypothetical protein